MKPLLLCSGEPAGVGPDLCLALAGSPHPLVVLCDKAVLASRARQLGRTVILEDYQEGQNPTIAPHHLTVLSMPSMAAVVPGLLNVANAEYVLSMLREATKRCLAGEFSALVTAPVHKAVLNEAGFAFSGHTEFLAKACQVKQVVMLLASEAMKVALVTTHLPLSEVPKALTIPLIVDVTRQLYRSLQLDFGIDRPKIAMAGLNPHAGEGGFLGREEIEVINPALHILKGLGIDVEGPMSADTMFVAKAESVKDAYVVMYHDQGLPVLKYSGFGRAVNITLGLPIIRTSVDHGTALALAGTGFASPQSLLSAVDMASTLSEIRALKPCHSLA
ncbi:MAG: 4-hydroxythreonine-4-phosphate dehydrogenase PdxA [Legionellales bacterium]|nr:4-hydroxythreonine-4-phosphate dehydrogenase PdxA [Legionellales bacterium]